MKSILITGIVVSIFFISSVGLGYGQEADFFRNE